MSYVTVYKRTVKRRKTGLYETYWSTYKTKSLTPMHKHIRESYSEAMTYQDPTKVITWFAYPILPLDEPIISGGTRIA